MAFSYRWITGNEISDFADKFAARAGAHLAAIPDFPNRRAASIPLWAEIRDLGWQGLLISEAEGGVDGTLSDLAAVLEGAGRHALPLPIFAAFGLSPLLLDAAGPAGADLRRGLADGSRSFCPVIEPLAARTQRRALRGFSCAETKDGACVLTGTVSGVETVPEATDWLIAARSSEGPVLCRIPADAAGVSQRAGQRMDGRPSADVTFSSVTVPADAVLARGQTLADAVERAADIGTVMTAVEVQAAMGRLIELTINYIKERRQFGQSLSEFQVLRHYLADIYVSYENAAALVEGNLRAAAAAEVGAEAVSLLRIRLSEAGGTVARTAIQMHGGMGLTEELAATRLSKRILMSEFEYGDGPYHTRRLVTLRQWNGDRASA